MSANVSWCAVVEGYSPPDVKAHRNITKENKQIIWWDAEDRCMFAEGSCVLLVSTNRLLLLGGFLLFMSTEKGNYCLLFMLHMKNVNGISCAMINHSAALRCDCAIEATSWRWTFYSYSSCCFTETLAKLSYCLIWQVKIDRNYLSGSSCLGFLWNLSLDNLDIWKDCDWTF